MGSAELVFTGCLTLDGGVSRPMDVVIRDDVIIAVHPSGTEEPPAGARVVPVPGLVVLPGLSNSHTHTPMVLMRGAAEDVTVDDWFNERVWPMEMNLTPERVRIGARLACAEMLLSGVTGFADHYFYADQIAEAAIELGIRADVAPTFFSSEDGRARDIAFEQTLAIAARGNSRVTASVGPHAPYTVTDADLRRSAEFAAGHRLRVHTHAAENLEQTRSSLVRRGETPVQVLEGTGVLDVGALIAHGCGITEPDLEVLARHSGRVVVGTCPKVYFKHDIDPMTPIRALLRAGVAVGTGTDGAAGHNTLDVWEAMRLTALAQKRQEHDPRWMPVAQALELGIVGGARACGSGAAKIAVEQGGRADLVFVDVSGIHCQPLHDLAATLVYAVRAGDVRTVVVGGELVVLDRKLLTFDLEKIVADARQIAPELLEIRPGEAVQTYAP